jgi:type I restriction enzyme R subunit
MIAEEVTETSAYLNPNLRGRDLRDAFDTPEFNLMIVANKFQTGFDQPKLCAMYVDKKLHGVDCVQTFSRLNRLFPGKVTFILDFFNDPQDILDAFLPYYNKAELERVSDAQIVYDLQRQLDDEDIYRWSEVAALAQAFFDPKAAHSKLNYHCYPAVDRYKQRYKATEAQRRQALDQKQPPQPAAIAPPSKPPIKLSKPPERPSISSTCLKRTSRALSVSMSFCRRSWITKIQS